MPIKKFILDHVLVSEKIDFNHRKTNKTGIYEMKKIDIKLDRNKIAFEGVAQTCGHPVDIKIFISILLS